MDIPDDRRYSEDHEWALAEGEVVRVGITDYAQEALGDVVFVQLPAVGAAVTAGEPLGEVESTKSVSDVYAPVSGTVVAINEDLNDSPNRLNDDPYGAGWICVIRPADPGATGALLDATAYASLTAD